MLFSCNLNIFSCIIYQNSIKKNGQFECPLNVHLEHFVFYGECPLNAHLNAHTDF